MKVFVPVVNPAARILRPVENGQRLQDETVRLVNNLVTLMRWMRTAGRRPPKFFLGELKDAADAYCSHCDVYLNRSNFSRCHGRLIAAVGVDHLALDGHVRASSKSHRHRTSSPALTVRKTISANVMSTGVANPARNPIKKVNSGSSCTPVRVVN